MVVGTTKRRFQRLETTNAIQNAKAGGCLLGRARSAKIPPRMMVSGTEYAIINVLNSGHASCQLKACCPTNTKNTTDRNARQPMNIATIVARTDVTLISRSQAVSTVEKQIHRPP